jgi:hypothetical protein
MPLKADNNWFLLSQRAMKILKNTISRVRKLLSLNLIFKILGFQVLQGPLIPNQ